MTSCISASSAYPTPPAIAVIAANSPADVVFVRLIIVAGAFLSGNTRFLPHMQSSPSDPHGSGLSTDTDLAVRTIFLTIPRAKRTG